MSVTALPSVMYKIAELQDSNFLTWRFRMERVLRDRNLWKYAIGEFPKPSTDKAGEQGKWEEHDQLALTQIVLSISDDAIAPVRDAKTSNEAWTRICAQYERKGLSAKVSLRRQLVTTRFLENSSMKTHINNIHELASRLIAINSPVKDEEIAMILLSSLPERFAPLIIGVEARPEEDITFDLISSLLLQEEARQSEAALNNPSTPLEAAFFAARTRAGTHKSTAVNNDTVNNDSCPTCLGRVCSYCGKPGHIHSTCHKKHGRPNNPSDSATSHSNIY
jgi:hypothetical protein